MISFDAAQASYAEHVQPLPSEPLPTAAASGRVLRADVVAAVDLPRFDQSAMDGYAIRHQDAPGRLPLQGRAEAGGAAPVLEPGSCVRILTGAPLPAGADTVVPQEQVESDARRVRFVDGAQPGRHIRKRAEEVAAGQRIAEAGQRLSPGGVAALCAAGVASVEVTRLPRVTVLVTGDEVVPAGQPLSDSATPDANGPLITAWLRAAGVADLQTVAVADTRQAVDRALAEALDQSDLVITSGGASVGDRDFIPEAADAAGLIRHFWKVAQKPGKPLLFASRGPQVLLALPGNPASVHLGLQLHLRSILARLAGDASPALPWQWGRLDARPTLKGDRPLFARARAHHDPAQPPRLDLLPGQGSHRLGNLLSANALVRLEPDDTGPWAAYLPI